MNSAPRTFLTLLSATLIGCSAPNTPALQALEKRIATLESAEIDSKVEHTQTEEIMLILAELRGSIAQLQASRVQHQENLQDISKTIEAVHLAINGLQYQDQLHDLSQKNLNDTLEKSLEDIRTQTQRSIETFQKQITLMEQWIAQLEKKS